MSAAPRASRGVGWVSSRVGRLSSSMACLLPTLCRRGGWLALPPLAAPLVERLHLAVAVRLADDALRILVADVLMVRRPVGILAVHLDLLVLRRVEGHRRRLLAK